MFKKVTKGDVDNVMFYTQCYLLVLMEHNDLVYEPLLTKI